MSATISVPSESIIERLIDTIRPLRPHNERDRNFIADVLAQFERGIRRLSVKMIKWIEDIIERENYILNVLARKLLSRADDSPTHLHPNDQERESSPIQSKIDCLERKTTLARADNRIDNSAEENVVANLSGRPVQTKQEMIAEEQARKATRQAAQGKKVKDRIADRGARDEALREGIFTKLRELGDKAGYAKTEEFIDSVQKYPDSCFSDGKVMRWFTERLEKLGASESEPSAESDRRELYTELCGNAETERWGDAMRDGGCSRGVADSGMQSANELIKLYRANRGQNWSGVKAIGRELGTCAYLLQIVAIDGDVLEVIDERWPEPTAEMATQRHADLVAKAISAITGRTYRGVPSAPKRISERRIK